MLEARADMEQALRALVTRLPPMERACLILKDVLGYSLSETAEIVDSTLGGVKAALHRGRSKVRASGVPPGPVHADASKEELLNAYVRHFNGRDWDRVRELIRSDARLEVVDSVETSGTEFIASTYFRNYSKMAVPWLLRVGRVDGELVLLCARLADGEWRYRSAVRVDVVDGVITRIRDYIHVPYLLDDSAVIPLGDEQPPLLPSQN